jgi:hypothetical protein
VKNLCLFHYFQRTHPGRLKEFDNYKSIKRPAETPLLEPITKKQKQLSIVGSSLSVPQNVVDSLVMDYIVQEMRPLATVEKPAFRRLLTGINPSVNVLCRKTLSVRLDENYDQMKANLKKRLSGAKYVCTTADIWSVSNKSYLGMTVHYINANESEDICRVSAALACRRFLGSHSYDHIAELISDIHLEYGLSIDKITATVTDNASNFGKAFREYMYCVEEQQNDNSNDDNIDVPSIGNVLTDEASDQSDIYLPHHETCFSHSLNLLATVDANAACELDAAYKRLYRAAMGKCTAIWNATHRSSKASDAVKAITDKSIISPAVTRWNSQFDSVKRILEVGTKINDICQAIETPKFKPTETECLEEYIIVMQPVAVALDKLQGQNDSFFGHVLPTLHTVKNKLTTMLQKHMKYSEPLLNALLQGMEKRFGMELSLSGAVADKIIAAVAHPFFKLRWLPDDKKDQCRQLFVEAVRKLDEQSTNAGDGVSASSKLRSTHTVDDDEFFDFKDTQAADVAVNEVEKECASYIGDQETDLTILSKYLRVKRVFVKFNTTLPSSAAVERLFSTAGQIEVPRRNCLSDPTFEKLLLLKANGIFMQ